ncbi:MAG: glycosyltransferase family A protein, partial [Planctomycetota bacterium]
MDSPTVSVVIPAYGHAAFIGDAVRSVLDQTTREPIEIIVVNDGSPDDTAGAVRPFVDAGQVRYIEQTNAGQAAARNRGIAEASGTYVQLLDDDDVLTPGKIDRQLKCFAEHPNAVCVYGSYQRVDAALKPLPDATKHAMLSGDVYDVFRESCKMLSPGQALFRRDAIDQVGGLDARIWGSDDWDLYIRLAKLGPFAFDG